MAEGGGLAEENEQVRVDERRIAELWQELTAATICDAKTLLVFQALRLRRPDLFV